MLEPRTVDHFDYSIPSPEDRREHAMWLHWIVRLRWVAIFAQVCTISFFVAVLTSRALTLSALAVIIGGLTAVNILTTNELERQGPVDNTELFNHLAVDVAALTCILALTGGPTNPFVMLYLVHVALGGIMLNRVSEAILIVEVVLGYGLLHVSWVPLNLAAHSIPAHTLQLAGQIGAFAITAASVGFFVSGAVTSLRHKWLKQRPEVPKGAEPLEP